MRQSTQNMEMKKNQVSDTKKKMNLTVDTLLLYAVFAAMLATGIVALFGAILGVAIFQVMGVAVTGILVGLASVIWTILVLLNIY